MFVCRSCGRWCGFLLQSTLKVSLKETLKRRSKGGGVVLTNENHNLSPRSTSHSWHLWNDFHAFHPPLSLWTLSSAFFCFGSHKNFINKREGGMKIIFFSLSRCFRPLPLDSWAVFVTLPYNVPRISLKSLLFWVDCWTLWWDFDRLCFELHE